MAGARKDQNGTLVYEVEDKELAQKMEENLLRRQFELFSNQSAIDGTLEEDEDELRIILLEECQNTDDMPIDEWNAYLDRELSVFKQGERYDFVKDLQDAYQHSLSQPLARRILRTIPEHVFHDIKKPIEAEQDHFCNPYNPARAIPGSDFFDIRTNYAWMNERERNYKLAPSVSQHMNF